MAETSRHDAVERVQFLARATSRVRVVEHLLAAGPSGRGELRQELGASRTTVSRALQSLAEAGWVEADGRTYRLTRAGELVGEAFINCLDTAAAVAELEEFLRWFPADHDLPPVLDAGDLTVTYSTDADPYAPARTQTEVLREAERLRVLLPAVDLDSTRTLVDQVVERGLEIETVLDPEVESTVIAPEFAPLLREAMETGRSSMFVTEAALPFYLGLADDGLVQVGLADADGLPRALLETTDGAVREWGERVYARFRERGSRLPASAFAAER